jgi:hypothetical protein
MRDKFSLILVLLVCLFQTYVLAEGRDMWEHGKRMRNIATQKFKEMITLEDMRKSSQHSLPTFGPHSSAQTTPSGFVYVSYYHDNKCSEDPSMSIGFPVNVCHVEKDYAYKFRLSQG